MSDHDHEQPDAIDGITRRLQAARADERARVLRELYERAPAIVNGTLGFKSTNAIARFRDCVNFAASLLARGLNNGSDERELLTQDDESVNSAPASSSGAIVPTSELPFARHEAAMRRLAAVGQYLYDTMNGDGDSSSDERPSDPLPELAMEHIRQAQELLYKALGAGRRACRADVDGLVLVERWSAASPSVGKEGGAWACGHCGAPAIHRDMLCSGSFLDTDHPPNVRAVPARSEVDGDR